MTIKYVPEIIGKGEQAITFEGVEIHIPFFQAQMRIKQLESQVIYLSEKLEEIIKTLEKLELYKEITDEQAETEIKNFILHLKKSGRTTMDIIDLVEELKLPPEQIEKIMDKFTKAGKIRELNA